MTVDTDFGEEVEDYLLAGFTGIWVHSHEQNEAIASIVRQAHGEEIPHIILWDAVDGAQQVMGVDMEGDFDLADGLLGHDLRGTQAPNKMLEMFLPEYEEKVEGDDKVVKVIVKPSVNFTKGDYERCLLIMKNLHPFLGKGPMNQLVMNILTAGDNRKQRLLVVSTESEVPKDLEKLFQPIKHPLPDAACLKDILYLTVSEEHGDIPADDEEVKAIVTAAAGLTRAEAANTFSLCVQQSKIVAARPVFEMKAQALKSSDLGLSLLKGDETFDDIGGLTNLKTFCTDMLEHRSSDPKLSPKGIILAGVPGTGKSLFAKALGNTLHPQRPTIRWDMGQTMSKYVGESQHRMQRCLDMVDAMAPCNLFADEFEKQVSTGMSGDTTSGDVQTQMLGQWLTWHQEHTSDVFVILTMNNIMAIARKMPEFLARFDEVFFLDFPGREQKDEIWKIHLEDFGLQPDAERPDDKEWTGRDIQKCCRQAAQRHIPLDKVRIGTLAKQVSESIDDLRDFATERWMSAEFPEYYRKDRQETVEEPPSSGRRDTVRKRQGVPV